MKKRTLIILVCLCGIFSLHSQIYIWDVVKDTSLINQSDQYGRQGTWYYYYRSTGKVSSEWEFLNDLEHGCHEFYSDSGRILTQSFYKYGMLDSIYREYFGNGRLHIEAYFEYGLPHGVTSTYNYAGELMTRITYKYGEIDLTDSLFYFSEDYTIGRSSKGQSHVWNLWPQLDTIVRYYPAIKYNKDYIIYYNGLIYKEIGFYNDKVRREDFYIKGKLTRRAVYSKKKPYLIEKMFYYNNKEKLYKTEFYDKKGVLIETVIKEGTVP